MCEYNVAEFRELKKKKRQWQTIEKQLEEEQSETRRLNEEVKKLSLENKESHDRMRTAEDQVVRFVERQMDSISKSSAAIIISEFEQQSRRMISIKYDNSLSDLKQLQKSLLTVAMNQNSW